MRTIKLAEKAPEPVIRKIQLIEETESDRPQSETPPLPTVHFADESQSDQGLENLDVGEISSLSLEEMSELEMVNFRPTFITFEPFPIRC